MTTTETSSYRMNHTMIRVKDVEKSLSFYQDICGMKLLRTSENKDAGFNLYFLGFPGGGVPKEGDSANGVNPVAGREGILELTWNYGTEKEEGQVYHNGNDQPQGFGHICFSVDDLDGACKYLEEKNVNWKKRLTDGRMKTVAFILDPGESFHLCICCSLLTPEQITIGLKLYKTSDTRTLLAGRTVPARSPTSLIDTSQVVAFLTIHIRRSQSEVAKASPKILVPVCCRRN